MDLSLVRTKVSPYGVFGELRQLSGAPVCFTLEHVFNGRPALPDGIYTCVRGLHRLAGHADPFLTFEVMNVPGHTGILLHRGNVNADSHGCILLGTQANETALLSSHIAFEKFMALQGDSSSFHLSVTSV